ncbi:MAG: SUMF1/EgtB/PvdO family nonheme iron enzyme [Kiritimatiellae bacterium]|jgi:formylglycine-generating enzyme required for sulfatase activity|nr:SUMF1/EgtB/PvdO family nonheme iron enzyme [Kiritimatiellia bacterium]
MKWLNHNHSSNVHSYSFRKFIYITVLFAGVIMANAFGDIIPVGKTDAVTISDENSGDGGTSYQLGGVGLINDGEMAGIELSLTGPGVLSFDWKVSSEADYDLLSFYEVGVGATNQISGAGGDWEHITLTVDGDSAAVHTFRWEYEKDPVMEYVGNDCGWIDAINWAPFYMFTVNNGIGDGAFTNGTLVSINADQPADYFEFDRWTDDTNTVADVFAPDTTIVMAGTGLVVTATYKPILYPLEVTYGSGSGSYPYGSEIEIGADSITGKMFYQWTGAVNNVADVAAPTTTVQTVDGTTAIAAMYSMAVTVNNGVGDGWYLEDSQVTLTADPDPMYQEFSGWSGDGAQYLDDPLSRTTTLTVPDSATSLTAEYAMSIARVAGCYGRSFAESGVEGGVTMNDSVASPSDTPVVQLGGSGVIPDNGFAAFETEVWGSGSITFMWKVMSESNADYLKFLVDDTEVEAISGTRDPWAQVTNRVEGAGVPHTLRWEYVKNGSIASSTDAAWVDNIVWMSDYPVPVRNPDILDVVVDSEAQGVRFVGEHGVHYIVYSNATLDADGWVPMEIEPVAFSEFNGVPVFQSLVMSAPAAGSCFFKVGLSAYTVTFINWDNSVLKTEQVVQGASATAPAVNPTRPSDDTYQYAFTGWDAAFNNIQSELTVTAQYEATLLPIYTVTFVNWDNSVLKTEQVVQGASATAPAVDPARPADTFYQYTFTGWDAAFNNVQSDLTVTAQYEATPAPDGMVLIPEGTNSGTDPDFGAYSLTVDTFYMDATEVTKAKWDLVYTWAVTNGYSFDNAGLGKASDHPVQTVSWYDCVKWCNARSEKEGRTPCYTVSGSVYRSGQSSPTCNFSANGYRLPTNDEWEYAARGGLSGKRFPWGDTIAHSQANYYSSSSYSYDISPTRECHPDYDDGGYPYTSPAGSFAANGYGLYDMAGNVWEWCNDASGSSRCIRGGSWISDALILRCGIEGWDDPGIATDDYGFRAVCR